MSERRSGVSRWLEGVGLGVGHVCIFGTVHGERRFHPTLRHQTHGLGINRFDPTNFSILKSLAHRMHNNSYSYKS